MTTLRNLCFTCYRTEDHSFIDILRKKYPMKYYIYQLEKCPSTEKLHFQGFIQFTKPINKKALHNYCAKESLLLHCSEMYSTVASCKAYCSKSDTKVAGPWEEGESTQQGSRNDLKMLAELVTDGASNRDIAQDHGHLFMKFHSGIDKLRVALQNQVRTWKTKVIYCYGPTGSGKSRFANLFDSDAYFKDLTSATFWDGYVGQETVVLDDLRAQHFPFTTLLRLLDRYKLNVQTKGGSTPFIPKFLIITSAKAPKDLYSSELQDKEDINQLLRRLDKVLHFDQTEWHLNEFDPEKIKDELSTEFDEDSSSRESSPRQHRKRPSGALETPEFPKRTKC